MKLKHLFIPLTGLALISLASPSYAASASWSSVAAGCIPESASANLVNSSAVSGNVSFKGSRTGRIRLTCPIEGLHSFPTPLDMGVTYYDPDGIGTTCQVRASLLRTSFDSERVDTAAGFDSNTDVSQTEPGTGRSLGAVQITGIFPETVNPKTSYYWIDLELSRSNTSCNPTAVGVLVGSVQEITD